MPSERPHPKPRGAPPSWPVGSLLSDHPEPPRIVAGDLIAVHFTKGCTARVVKRRKARRCTRKGAAAVHRILENASGTAKVRVRASTVTHACKATRSTTSACAHSAMYTPAANTVQAINEFLAMKLRSALSRHASVKIAASLLFAVQARRNRPQEWGPRGTHTTFAELASQKTNAGSLGDAEPTNRVFRVSPASLRSERCTLS